MNCRVVLLGPMEGSSTPKAYGTKTFWRETSCISFRGLSCDSCRVLMLSPRLIFGMGDVATRPRRGSLRGDQTRCRPSAPCRSHQWLIPGVRGEKALGALAESVPERPALFQHAHADDTEAPPYSPCSSDDQLPGPRTSVPDSRRQVVQQQQQPPPQADSGA